MSLLYYFRFFVHWLRFFIYVDPADALECEHYYYSKKPNNPMNPTPEQLAAAILLIFALGIFGAAMVAVML